MSNYGNVLKALFKNKLRFDEGKSTRKKVALLLFFGLVYVLVMGMLINVIVELRPLFLYMPGISQMFYFFVLLTAAIVVLFFGIVHLVTVLYLSKDTDFYSALPIKPATVFAAKLSYVYLFETAIVVAIALPILIAFGIVAQMWAGFYIIAISTLLIAPVFPLVIAAIFAVPVMFIASKLKNRSVVSLIFYLILFGGVFSLYIYFVAVSSSGEITPDGMERMLNAMRAVLYVFYPYTVLSSAACAVPLYGLNLASSTAVGLVIFMAVSIALLAVIWFLARFTYSQSVKANNQTDNSKAKKGEFKASSGIKALIKREYISSLRTTQTAFQCYAVILLPIIVAVVFGIVFGNYSAVDYGDASEYVQSFLRLTSYCTLCAIFATLGNAACSTFSREGDAISSLKILPVSVKTILKAKIIAWLILAVPAATVAVVVYNVFNFSLSDMLLSLFSLVPIAVVFVIFGALWDLTSPKLKWTDPMQAIKHNMHLLGGQLIMIASGLGALIFLLVLSGFGVDLAVVYNVMWGVLYGIFAVFAIVDILLYRNADKYYKRIEM